MQTETHIFPVKDGFKFHMKRVVSDEMGPYGDPLVHAEVEKIQSPWSKTDGWTLNKKHVEIGNKYIFAYTPGLHRYFHFDKTTPTQPTEIRRFPVDNEIKSIYTFCEGVIYVESTIFDGGFPNLHVFTLTSPPVVYEHVLAWSADKNGNLIIVYRNLAFVVVQGDKITTGSFEGIQDWYRNRNSSVSVIVVANRFFAMGNTGATLYEFKDGAFVTLYKIQQPNPLPRYDIPQFSSEFIPDGPRHFLIRSYNDHGFVHRFNLDTHSMTHLSNQFQGQMVATYDDKVLVTPPGRNLHWLSFNDTKEVPEQQLRTRSLGTCIGPLRKNFEPDHGYQVQQNWIMTRTFAHYQLYDWTQGRDGYLRSFDADYARFVDSNILLIHGDTMVSVPIPWGGFTEEGDQPSPVLEFLWSAPESQKKVLRMPELQQLMVDFVHSNGGVYDF